MITMGEVFDFLVAALPYIAIGFWVAFTIVQKNAKDAGQEMKMQWGNYFPSAAMVFVSVLEFADGDTSNGTTWLVLAIAFLALNLASGRKTQK